jgi:hypothetical protein
MEEAGLAPRSNQPAWWSEDAHGTWAYTTVVTRWTGPRGFTPEPSNHESERLEWVRLPRVPERRLHGGLAAAWPRLAPRLDARLTLVVDIANVMGSVNDGWYRDRLAAARRLRDQLAPLARAGIPGDTIGWPECDGFYPRLVLVVEGKASPLADEEISLQDAADGVQVVRAPRDGDGQIVAEVAAAIGDGDIAVVATADRELRERVAGAGGWSMGPGALRRLASSPGGVA